MDHSLRLLLVEDGRADAMITRVLIGEAARINGHGYDVDHAVDFSGALLLLAGSAVRPYDVCMLDLGLPDASGVALVAEVEKRYPHVAIVVNSGAEDPHLAEESLASGAQEFLKKGQVTAQSMALTLRNAVLRARLRTELAESEAEHRALFDFSPSPIWVLEAATMRVLRANRAACELHGYPLPQLMTMYFPELQPDESIDDLKQAFFGDTPPKRIWRQRPQKGPAIYVQLTAHRIAVRSGEAIIVTAQRVLLGGS